MATNQERNIYYEKHYPSILNVVLLTVIFCLILANQMVILMPWLVDIGNTIISIGNSIIAITTNGFILISNTIANVYNTYTIFTIHAAIIALYIKQLFGKEAKLRYQTAVDALESYTPPSDKLINVNCINTCNALEDHIAPLYIKTCLVLFIIVFNIVYPNFYQFTILQALSKACNNSIDNTFMLSISPLLVIMLVLIPIVIGCILANIKANRMLNKMLHNRPLCS